MNLKVWLDHYIWQGVEHFYLIDNGSSDQPLDILKDYINKKLVTYIYKPDPYKQLEHYRSVFKSKTLKKESYWLIIADLDEFFYGLKNKIINILPYLNKFDVVYCNWIMFGSNDLDDHPKDIRISITNSNNKFHDNKKYIFKTNSIINPSQIQIHKIDLVKRIYCGNSVIHLNHYPIQSKEYFKAVKIPRGDVNNRESNKIRNWEYFKKYDLDKIKKDDYLKSLIQKNFH
jgi:hypothetical protein